MCKALIIEFNLKQQQSKNMVMLRNMSRAPNYGSIVVVLLMIKVLLLKLCYGCYSVPVALTPRVIFISNIILVQITQCHKNLCIIN